MRTVGELVDELSKHSRDMKVVVDGLPQFEVEIAVDDDDNAYPLEAEYSEFELGDPPNGRVVYIGGDYAD